MVFYLQSGWISLESSLNIKDAIHMAVRDVLKRSAIPYWCMVAELTSVMRISETRSQKLNLSDTKSAKCWNATQYDAGVDESNIPIYVRFIHTYANAGSFQ